MHSIEVGNHVQCLSIKLDAFYDICSTDFRSRPCISLSQVLLDIKSSFIKDHLSLFFYKVPLYSIDITKNQINFQQGL